MLIIMDLIQEIFGLTCGCDGDDSFAGDVGCSDFPCTGSVTH